MYIDILILALLHTRPRHGYELRKDVENALGRQILVNNNQLYPALRRLDESGAIRRDVEHQRGRPDRHVYQLTERGWQMLQALLRDCPRALAADDAEFLTRVAFFDLLDPAARRAILTTRRVADTERLAVLTAAKSQVAGELRHRFVDRLLTLEMERVQRELASLDTMLEEIDNS